MARTSNVSREDLIDSFAAVFRRHGFEGASMSELSKEAGLQKASLYHRFPGGKEEMAIAVLDRVDQIIEENIVVPLHNPDITPEEKTDIFIESMEAIYNGGCNSCLFNVLSYPTTEESPFFGTIKKAFETLEKTLSHLLQEYGASAEDARKSAQTILMLIQGSLVLSKGMNSTEPFQDALKLIQSMIHSTKVS